MKYMLGFRPLKAIEQDGLIHKEVATTISISKGDTVFDNGSGYATNAATAFSNLFIGVAAADADNTSGADGAIKVKVIPPRPSYKFIVQNDSATKAAQTDISDIVDLEATDGIDVSDTTCVSWGFQIEEIDISDEALAADDVESTDSGGFVIEDS